MISAEYVSTVGTPSPKRDINNSIGSFPSHKWLKYQRMLSKNFFFNTTRDGILLMYFQPEGNDGKCM